MNQLQPPSLSDLILTGQVSDFNINTLACPVKFTDDIFEFCESSEFLEFTLKKKQRFVLEEFYKKDENGEDLYNILVAIIGMRAGKSALGAFMGSFALQYLLSFDSPQKHYGLLPGDEIYIVTTANSASQSKETIYAKLSGFFNKTPYWRKYIGWLQEREKKEKGLRVGSLFSSAGTYADFKEKNVHLKAEHSNSASLAGKTIYYYLSDEISRADTADEEIQEKEEKRSAQAVFNTLQKGTQTFGMKGKTGVFTSPMFEDDYGMQLLYNCKTIHAGKHSAILNSLIDQYKKPRVSTYLGVYYASKEFNPDLADKTLDAEKQKSPKTFERDYEAIPPKTASPLFEDEFILDRAIVNREEIVKFEDVELIQTLKDQYGKSETRVLLGKKLVGVKPDKLTRRWISCDPGESDCAFVVGMAHGEERELDYGGTKLKRLVTIYDAIIVYKGEKERRVDFGNVRDIIKELNKYYSIKKVTYDRWQSTESLQELFKSGIYTEILGTDKAKPDDFYNDLFNGVIELPNNPEVITQLKKLKLVKGKVSGSKDIADVLFRLNYLIREAETQTYQVKDMLKPQSAIYTRTASPSGDTNSGSSHVAEGIWGKTKTSNKFWTPRPLGGN